MPKVGTLAGLNIGRKKIKFSKIKAKVKDSGEDEVRFFPRWLDQEFGMDSLKYLEEINRMSQLLLADLTLRFGKSAVGFKSLGY